MANSVLITSELQFRMIRNSLLLQVECYAGYRGEETPRRFMLGDRKVEVVEILDSWLAPDHRYFKLRCDDGATYILRNDVSAGNWGLTLFERGSTCDIADPDQ